MEKTSLEGGAVRADAPGTGPLGRTERFLSSIPLSSERDATHEDENDKTGRLKRTEERKGRRDGKEKKRKEDAYFLLEKRK